MFNNIHKSLSSKFHNLVAYLIWDKEWLWLHWLISLLCDIEMNVRLLFDTEFYHHLLIAHIKPRQESKFPFEEIIPKNTFYCEDCAYHKFSRVAQFFFGSQCCGYCYLIDNGDYRFFNATDLLWDGCKECGKFIDIEEDDYVEEN